MTQAAMEQELNETQKLIAKSASDFAARVVAPRAAELDKSGVFPSETVQGLAEQGLLGVNLPSRYGAAEAGVVSYALAMIEIAKACASTAVTMAVTNMVGEVVQTFGSEAQRDEHLPKLTSGEHVTGAFALREPGAGSDLKAKVWRDMPPPAGRRSHSIEKPWALCTGARWLRSWLMPRPITGAMAPPHPGRALSSRA
mgnify:CR=1 FL=1